MALWLHQGHGVLLWAHNLVFCKLSGFVKQCTNMRVMPVSQNQAAIQIQTTIQTQAAKQFKQQYKIKVCPVAWICAVTIVCIAIWIVLHSKKLSCSYMYQRM